MLFDTGPSWPGGDAGQATVLPFLMAQELRNLDLILVSHADGDHSGGLASVRDKFPRTPLLMSRADSSGDAWRCRQGMNWQWDDVEFQILHPRSPTGWSDNNASCVLAVTYRGAQALFPGDIEAAAELVMLARHARLRSQLVIVPHHGSSTSSGRLMTRRVSPQYAVHTTSFWNRWSFPASEVVERWRDIGSCQLDTALTGGLRFDWTVRRGLVLTQVRSAHWTRPWAVRPVSDNYCLEA
jgi:competence protein ComEC